MKQTFLIAFALISTFNVYSQNDLLLKTKYSPETTYNQVLTQTTEMSLKYSGPDEFLQNLKSKGVENPTVTNGKSVTKIKLRTGKLSSGKEFPLTMEFLESADKEGNQLVPNGTIVYGRGYEDKVPRLDSIVSAKLDDDFKKNMLQVAQSTISQLELPEKKLKIGESLSQETPLTIPMGDKTIEMVITTIYKLESIKNNFGYFDVIIKYTMKSDMYGSDITGSGTGNGKVIFDIKNNFFSNFQTDSTITMATVVQGITVSVDIKGGYNQAVEISK